MSDRYATEGLAEASHEPGSGKRVLANMLGINRVRAMHAAESSALLSLTDALLDEVTQDQRFRAEDLQDYHRRWLGDIYPWAGKCRQVNIARRGFQFASAQFISRLMADYDRDVLATQTPCAGMNAERLSHALARTHAEFILIHPFREGNGRLARLLNSLMAWQAGLPALDYGGIRGREKQAYIAAIHRAMDRDYAPLERMFSAVIARTLRTVEP